MRNQKSNSLKVITSLKEKLKSNQLKKNYRKWNITVGILTPKLGKSKIEMNFTLGQSTHNQNQKLLRIAIFA